MNKFKILVIEPRKEPSIKTVNNIENALVKIIGDNLKNIRLKNNIDLVYNDEGKINNLDFNRIITDDVLCGTFAIVGQYKDEWVSLTSKQIRFYKKRFQLKHDEPLLQFMRDNIKQSSDLLTFNLKGIEKFNKIVISDKKFKNMNL